MSVLSFWPGLIALVLLVVLVRHQQRQRSARQPGMRPERRNEPAYVASTKPVTQQAANIAVNRAETRTKTVYTTEEVSRHCTRESLWLIIDGRVYDVTSYVDHHPGGDAIFRNAGRDSSAGFHGDQHPEKVNEIIPDFYIGDLKQ